ncbi:septum site-determining protein MinC, partial [Streptococcus hyovaginalis]
MNSNLVTKKEAENWLKQNELKSITSIVRSGQVLEVPGDLLLIGDVNPGGKVIAGGNIYIMGQLKGIAHAGYNGKDDAVIAASVMKPTQIRISRFIERELGNTSSEKTREMECAYVNDSVIKIDRLQVLPHLRPN